jgi:ABC-type sugar transport system ATPase subunit
MAVLELRNVSKRFPGVRALTDVSLAVERGQVHALLGGNGAGKSTVVNLIGGVFHPDAGEILFDGAPVRFRDPRDAVAQGVAVIHQELTLVPGLSVAENLFLGRLPRRAGMVDWRELRRGSREVLQRVGLDIDPSAHVGELPTGPQQQIEIARAIASHPKLLLMDEPTSALTTREVERLFEVIRLLRAEGLAVVFVSHRFDEVWQIADRITVLRDGRIVYSGGNVADVTRTQVVEFVVGHELIEQGRRQRAATGEPFARVRGLSSDKLVEVELDVCPGEVIGIAGALGAGKSELLRALFGADDSARGEIEIDGQRVRLDSPVQAIKRGIFLVPEDRKRQGLVLGMSVADNITLPYLDTLSVAGLLSSRRQSEIVRRFVKRLAIMTPGLRQRVVYLSGGNQQKVVLARWMALRPRLLLLDEPTRGLDVGAKEEIYQVIEELTASGVAILFVATELPELLRVCDRVLVLRAGAVARKLDARGLSEKELFLATYAGEVAAA